MFNAFLPDDQLQIVHEKTIKLLEKNGVRIDHPEGRKLLVKAGAKEDGEFVKIPGELIEEVLKLNIPEFQVYDRDGNPAMLLNTENSFCGSGSDALFQIDMETNEKRDSTMKDIEKNMRLLDKLDQFDFVMSTGLPQPNEVPGELLYKKVFEVMAENTAKPIITALTCLEDIIKVHESAVEIAGSSIKEKPYFMSYLEPISPLYLNKEVVDKMLYCVDNNIPFTFAGSTICGLTAPITLEGGIIQGNAEFLAGYTIAKLRNPKALALYGANTATLHPRTMFSRYGCPEWAKATAFYAVMGRYYKMPIWGTGCCTDAKNLGVHAIWEAQQGLTAAFSAGVTIIHDVGYFDYGNTYDPRMLFLANDMIKRERFLQRPFNFNDDYLEESMDVITEITRQNESFPNHMHTAKYLRKEVYIPPKYLDLDRDILESLKIEVEKIWS